MHHMFVKEDFLAENMDTKSKCKENKYAGTLPKNKYAGKEPFELKNKDAASPDTVDYFPKKQDSHLHNHPLIYSKKY